jgi:hypothetical protein
MSQNQNLLYSYLLPVLLTIALLVTSVLLGIVNLTNLLIASLLFVVIGLSVFFAELMIGRYGRGFERQETYTLIVRVQDIVNSFERAFYLDEDSGHREHCQAV